MNKTILKGNLARDPELRTITTGAGRETQVANFTVAVSRFFKRADGTSDRDTVFIPCEAWDTGAKSIEKLLKKGDPILLEGSLKMESWEKDGTKHSRMKVRVSNFDKLYRAPKREDGEDADSDIPSDDAPVEADAEVTKPGEDIPF